VHTYRRDTPMEVLSIIDPDPDPDIYSQSILLNPSSTSTHQRCVITVKHNLIPNN